MTHDRPARVPHVWDRARRRRERRALAFLAIFDRTGDVDERAYLLMDQADGLVKRLVA